MPSLTEALNAGLAMIRADKSVASVVVAGLSIGGVVRTFEIFRDESIRQIDAK
jgi:hypothetical protein